MAYRPSFSLPSYEFQSLSLGSEDDAVLYCHPCSNLDKRQEPAYGYCQDCAEHLCETCYKVHKRPAPSRNHVLLDRSQMPTTQGPGQISVETCTQHDGEAIKYYCKTHSIFGCSPCVTINHRTCDIVYISDAAKDFKSSQELRNLLQRIEGIKSSCEGVEEKKAKVQKSREAIKNEIKTFRKQINDQIDKWEMDLYSKNDSFHDEELGKVTSSAQNREELLKYAEKIQDNLTRLKTTENNTRLYIEAKKVEKTIQTLEKCAECMKLNREFKKPFRFMKNDKTMDFLSSENCIGRIYIPFMWKFMDRDF